MRIRTSLLGVFMSLLMIGGGFVSAQVPENTEVQAQAAAYTLDSGDLPTGFSLTGETFLGQPDSSIMGGLQAAYLSVYTNLDSGQVIRSYVYLFETPEQAAAGLQVAGGNQEESIEHDSLEAGDGEAVLLTGSYTNAESAKIGTADAMFVRGPAVVGVALDNPDGTQPDVQLAKDLAKRADDRAQAIQAGDAPVDLELPGKVVPFAANGVVIQAGYLNSSEAESVYDVQGSGLSNLESTWVQTVGYGEDGAAPRVTIGITTFDSADEAKDVVEQSENIFASLPDQEKAPDVKVDGADSVAAFTYTSRDGTAGAKESYRIIFSIDSTVTVVDIQGASDGPTAQAAANSIVSAQIRCQTDGVCERPAAEGVIPGE